MCTKPLYPSIVDPISWRIMSKHMLAKMWEDKSDQGLISAGKQLSAYNQEAVEVM